MSCNPGSEDLLKPDRYEKSWDSASSICGAGLEDAGKMCAIRLERTAEVSRGIGSSGFEDVLRRGRKGWKGLLCLTKATAELGISGTSESRNI